MTDDDTGRIDAPVVETDDGGTGGSTRSRVDDQLPVPIAEVESPPSIPEPRPYIEIRPTETPLDTAAVEQAMTLLERVLRDTTNTGLRAKLARSTQQPLVEFLFVSDGREDPSIRYLVGSTHNDLMEDLEGILRTCFPNSYEVRQIAWHPRYIEEHLPVTIPADEPPEDPYERRGPHHPSITPDRPYVAGVEYVGRANRKQDWQTPLETFAAFTNPTHQPARHRQYESRRVPTASVIEAMCDATLPVMVQVVVRPYDDWSGQAETYIRQLDEGQISFADAAWDFLFPRDPEDRRKYDPPPADQERIDGIAERDPRRTLCVSARAVALTRDDPPRADAVARRLQSTFGHVSGRNHEITGRVATDDELYPGIGPPPGGQIYEDLCTRANYHATYYQLGDSLRRRPHESKGIVVTPAELPGLCILDGAGLTPKGRRALATRPAEQAGIALPPPRQLLQYRPPGMVLGMPLTHDRQPYGQPLALPPALQDRHVILMGDTGAGKTVSLLTAMLTNVRATAGPAIFFDYKGGGTAQDYLRAHYAAYGSLEDVLYFDLTRVLPALSVFDIGPLLDAGIPREEARSRKAGHYEEILEGVMGAERYGRAVESPKVIRNHLRACFDPVHGADAVSHADLYAALQRTLGQREPPPVSDDQFAEYFAGLLDRDRDVFNMAVGGAVSRVESIATDGRLAPLFDHVPTGDGPRLDFTDLVDENTVIIFDFGGMETAAKRTLTLAILSTLWTALKARAEAPDDQDDRSPGDDPPLVNLYLDDARDVADTALVDTLLSQGRSFGLSVTLGVQFPGQLDSPDPETDTYREALNETATIVSGKVSVDDDLATVLATDEMPPAEVERRLATMRRGEWLLRPGAAFGEHTPRPFLVESLPAPPGHPASNSPLEGADRVAFQEAFQTLTERTEADHGLSYREQEPGVTEREAGTADPEAPEAEPTVPTARVDSFLPYTERFPGCVEYDPERHAIRCRACGNRYDPTIEGMARAIECCHSLDDVDRDDIPVHDSHLKLSPEERAISPWTDRQNLFLQAVYNAQQRRYDPLEYDITRDSMLRLQEYVGIDAEAVQELLDAGLLRHDTDRPHKLYSVAPQGRSAIGEAYREGVDYGHGKGDLEESSEHVLGMVLGERLVEQEFIDDPDHPGETCSPYHEIDDGQRLDIAVLDADDEVVVAIEVERINHDYREAVPEDFDKMASVAPEEAIWIVIGRQAGHTVLEALNDPPDGEPRVEKTYAENTPPHQFRIDTPGLTAIYPVGYIRESLLER